MFNKDNFFDLVLEDFQLGKMTEKPFYVTGRFLQRNYKIKNLRKLQFSEAFIVLFWLRCARHHFP